MENGATKHRAVKIALLSALCICIRVADTKQSDAMDSLFQENGQNDEDWVDPFNMFEYKPSTNNKGMSSEDDKNVENYNARKDEEAIAKEIRIEFNCAESTKKESETCQDYLPRRHEKASAEVISCQDEKFLYLKRTANMILNKVEDLKQDSQSNVIHVKLTVTDELVNVLKIFIDSPCKHVQEFDSLLSVMLNNAELTEDHDNIGLFDKYVIQFSQSETVMYGTMIFLAMTFLWFYFLRLTPFQIVTRLIVLIFCISFIWNWILLYKEENASAHARAEKMTSSECHVNNFGITKKMSIMISSMFFPSHDSCKQYYENVFIEPVWKVSPLIVLSRTSSELFFHPLGLLGKHLGSFYQNLFSSLSWYLVVPVSGIVTIIILLLLLMIFKYRIRLPFGLGAIEPDQQQHTSQTKFITDVLEGRVLIQRTDSLQNVNVNERSAPCSVCNKINTSTQKTVMPSHEQDVRNSANGIVTDETKGTYTSTTEPSSLSSLCQDTLNNTTLDGKIQNLKIVSKGENDG